MAVKIYSTPTCPYCKMVQEYLKEKDVEFEYIDVAADKKAANEMIEKSGQMGVPVIEIDGKVIVGFNKEEIEKALSQQGNV
ncbi:MAG: glutaredoxin family protein [Candidatus Altiarchaeales archaeon]|nr:glutaredoxin family protein [Candidatus Altiarchaeota archaeon]MCG2783348.1 glutaredoxin family protein [Candidatus Altiarchaeales archaeon]